MPNDASAERTRGVLIVKKLIKCKTKLNKMTGRQSMSDTDYSLLADIEEAYERIALSYKNSVEVVVGVLGCFPWRYHA